MLPTIISVCKCLAGVVRRVDEHQLDLPCTRLLKVLEHLKVVAFDDLVASRGCIDRRIGNRQQHAGRHAGHLQRSSQLRTMRVATLLR